MGWSRAKWLVRADVCLVCFVNYKRIRDRGEYMSKDFQDKNLLCGISHLGVKYGGAALILISSVLLGGALLVAQASAEVLDSCESDENIELTLRCPRCKADPFEFTVPVSATIPGPCTGTSQRPVSPPELPAGGWICKETGCTVTYDRNGGVYSSVPPSCTVGRYCLPKQPGSLGGVNVDVPQWLKDGFNDFKREVEGDLQSICLCRPHCRVRTCEAAGAPDFKLTQFDTATSADNRSCNLSGTATATGKCSGVCKKTGA